jgi:hypothetical protein
VRGGPNVHTARRPCQQPQSGEFHAALSIVRYPSGPSGHAGFGGAVFETLKNYYGTDEIPFTFVSDELNGTTKDANGTVRPLIPRSYQLSRRPRRKMVKAAPISASTGRPTRTRGSRRDGRWPTTCSVTPSYRLSRIEGGADNSEFVNSSFGPLASGQPGESGPWGPTPELDFFTNSQCGTTKISAAMSGSSAMSVPPTWTMKAGRR